MPAFDRVEMMSSESLRGGSCQMYTLARWTGNSYLEPNSCSFVFWNKQQHTLSGCWTEWGGSEGFGGVHISEM